MGSGSQILILIVFIVWLTYVNSQDDASTEAPADTSTDAGDGTDGGGATDGGGGTDGTTVNAQCGIMKGVVRSRFRVIGGGRAIVGNYPWQVLIVKNRIPICGGTIIDDNFVLTAAHCIQANSIREYRIIAGTQAKYNQDRLGTTHLISRVVYHPQFNRRLMTANLAIAAVSPAFNFRRGLRGIGSISPICLVNKNQIVLANTPAIISGYGWSRRGASESYLKAARVRVLNHAYCERAYKSLYYYDRRSMICAGTVNGGTDACYGDGGGPLSVEVRGRVTQIGIVSHGFGCARPGFPRIFMKVASFRNWIQAQIQNTKKAKLQKRALSAVQKKKS